MARHFDFTDRGNATNEDFARAGALPGGRAYGVVIDGATGLSGEPLFPGRFATNAQWLAQTVGGETCRALEAGSSAADALSRAVLAARAEYEAALGRPVELADPDAVPSATLALAVVGEDDVELWGLGDSPLAVLRRDGSLAVSTDETLEELDGRAVALMAERAAGRDLTAPEKRSLVSDVVLANRRLRNSVGGYWCLDPTGSGLAHARRLTLPRREVVAVAGMSDGLFRAFGQYGMARLEDELAGLTPRSVRRLVARMRELEASDPLLVRFPRLKVGDDASMFWIAP